MSLLMAFFTGCSFVQVHAHVASSCRIWIGRDWQVGVDAEPGMHLCVCVCGDLGVARADGEVDDITSAYIACGRCEECRSGHVWRCSARLGYL